MDCDDYTAHMQTYLIYISSFSISLFFLLLIEHFRFKEIYKTIVYIIIVNIVFFPYFFLFLIIFFFIHKLHLLNNISLSYFIYIYLAKCVLPESPTTQTTLTATTADDQLLVNALSCCCFQLPDSTRLSSLAQYNKVSSNKKAPQQK